MSKSNLHALSQPEMTSNDPLHELVPEDRPSSCQRSSNASTCLPLSDDDLICWKPASRSCRATSVNERLRSAWVVWLPSRLRWQSWRRV